MEITLKGLFSDLFQHATKDEGKGVGVVTSSSQAPQDTVVRGLEGGPEEAGVGRGGDDLMTGVHGLKSGGIELLRAQL